MNPLKAIMQQAVMGMGVEQRRITLASENISNADTPGYQRKLLMVEPSPSDQFQQMRVALDQAPGERLYEPSNPMADADGYVTKSNVSLVMEMADMREANRTYEANLNSLQQARTMYRSLLDILRR